jgi:hypothetical protein
MVTDQLAEGADRPFHFPILCQIEPETVSGIGVVWLDSDGVAGSGNGMFLLLVLGQDVATVVRIDSAGRLVHPPFPETETTPEARTDGRHLGRRRCLAAILVGI